MKGKRKWNEFGKGSRGERERERWRKIFKLLASRQA